MIIGEGGKGAIRASVGGKISKNVHQTMGKAGLFIESENLTLVNNGIIASGGDGMRVFKDETGEQGNLGTIYLKM